MQKLIVESVGVGIITALIGSIIARILVKFNQVDDNEVLNETVTSTLEKWRKNYMMEISLFLTGVLIHLVLEYVGLNSWYCKKECAQGKCEMVCRKPVSN